jgi:hypothetical protein
MYDFLGRIRAYSANTMLTIIPVCSQIENGTRGFVQVCSTFQGHVARGTTSINLDNTVHNLGTWAVANIDATGAAWGAISFLQGSDGGAGVATTDGSNERRECVVDLLNGAPDAALTAKGSGVKVLNKVVGDGASVDGKYEELSPRFQVILMFFLNVIGDNPRKQGDTTEIKR